jgi:DNA-binding MarR family transcriptional regulator
MTLQTRFEDADDSPGLLLWRVSMRWQAEMRAALAPFGLTHTQFVLLASLAWLGSHSQDCVTQRDLADHAATDIMMTSQVLRTLEAKGFLVRRPHPQDARARDLRITPAGTTVVNKAIVAVESCDAAFFARAGRTQDGLVQGLRAAASSRSDFPPAADNPGASPPSAAADDSSR